VRKYHAPICSSFTKNIAVPIIHIADATAEKINKAGFKKVALLGTKASMERDFYKGRLKTHGIETLIPVAADRDFIQQTIFQELFQHDFRAESRKRFLNIIDDLYQKGAEAAVLGCTEIPLLVKQKDTSIPLFDTLTIHAHAIVNFITEEK